MLLSPLSLRPLEEKKMMNIPTILESLARDIENGGTWEQAAAELCRAGWSNYIDIEQAKRLVTPYLTKKN